MASYRGEQWRASLERVERLKVLAQTWGITTSQLAIAWVLANPAITVVLVGAKSARQVEENAAPPRCRSRPNGSRPSKRSSPATGRRSPASDTTVHLALPTHVTRNPRFSRAAAVSGDS